MGGSNLKSQMPLKIQKSKVDCPLYTLLAFLENWVFIFDMMGITAAKLHTVSYKHLSHLQVLSK